MSANDDALERRALDLVRIHRQGGSQSGTALIVRMLCDFASSEVDRDRRARSGACPVCQAVRDTIREYDESLYETD